MGNGSSNGEGLKNLARQMTETGERLAAWIFRALIGAMSVMLIVIGWFAIDKLASFDKKFDALETSRTSMWVIVQSIIKTENEQTVSMTRLETSLTDYIKNQDRIISQLAGQEIDHEQRMRQLEHPPPH